MTLDGFKTIFWWEWSHRLLARVLGLVFVAAGAVFLGDGAAQGTARRRKWRWRRRCWRWSRSSAGGWSPRACRERTEVAQERLALHLLIAAGDLRER